MKINLILFTSILSASLLMGQNSAEALYNKKCASCHGINANKKALNTSKILNTLSKEEIKNALLGYKNGTYGGKLKNVKRGVASSLSENDIDILAEYVQLIKP